MGVIDCFAYAEDALSCAVMERLVEWHNATPHGNIIRFKPGFPENKRGKSHIRKLIPKICQMAKGAGIATFILTDLDEGCPPELIRRWFGLSEKNPVPPENILFRIAEREVESWVLADREGLGAFLRISPVNFNDNPDGLDDPKQHLLNIIRSKGRKKIHKAMLPGKTSHVGPEYNPILCDFIRNHWNIEKAAGRSESLNRAIRSIMRFGERLDVPSPEK